MELPGLQALLPRLSLPQRYLTRDLIGTLVPFSGFVLLALLAGLLPIGPVLLATKDASPAVALPVFLLVYAAAGYCTGKVAGALGVALTGLVALLPRVGHHFSFARQYARNRVPIEGMFAKVFGKGARFEMSQTDKVNTLKSHFAKFDPDGAAAVMRQFMLLDIARASGVYGLVLFVAEAWAGMQHPGMALVCIAIVALSAVATPRRIKKIVRTELSYLQNAERIEDKQDEAKAAGVVQAP